MNQSRPKKRFLQLGRNVLIILTSLMVFSSLLDAEAFHYPGNPPSDDGKFNNFGPTTPNLLITPYGSQEDEYLAFKAGDVDFMDWSLTASQVSELNALDPNMVEYSRAFYADNNMRQFDLNNLRFPTSDVQFRRALSHCFDKTSFVENQLGGYGIVMDSPLQNHGSWFNPYCANLYPYDLTEAASILGSAAYVDHDSDGYREGPANEEIVLDVYIRSDLPDLDLMGAIFCANLRSIGLDVNEQHQPRSVCNSHCYVEPWDYHVYTGRWSFGRDPDTLYSLYHSQYAQAFDGTPNYPGYTNPAFDVAADNMLTATISGVPYSGSPAPGTAAAYVWEMQQVLMDDSGVIPVFTWAGYGAYKAGWNKVVNALDQGPWSRYTFLNTNKPGEDTIRWGFSGDIEEYVNPLQPMWVWDGRLVDLVYDSATRVNPYDTAQDLPWLAQNWTIGEWNFQGSTCTTITFRLREDVYWHDVPAKADRVTPGGAPLLTSGASNVQFTADDFIFSLYALRDDAYSWVNCLPLEYLVCAEKIDPYKVKVYLDLYMPLWARHWLGSLPIVPKHVWEPIFLEEGTLMFFDPIAQKCFVGTGPWIFDYEASSIHNYYMLRANPRFFRYHPLDITGLTESKVVQPSSDVAITFAMHWMDSQRLSVAGSEFNYTITLVSPYDCSVSVAPPETTYNVSGGTPLVIGPFQSPPLTYCEELLFASLSFRSLRGLVAVKIDVSPDPATGHTDLYGYPISIWGTINQDINLDFYVNAKDAVVVGAAFGSRPGSWNWNPASDINNDGFVNAKDAVKLGTVFGWPG